MSNVFQQTHIRTNILTGAEVLISPHRTQRPWQGAQEQLPQQDPISYDPDCYLCPGNTRANGAVNPNYTHTYTFVNDFSALTPQQDQSFWQEGLLEARSESGICKVICFAADHSQQLSQMSSAQLLQVVQTWQREFKELSQLPGIQNIQIFENKGAVMGCSNPHPHGQIWAQQSIPQEIRLKSQRFQAHHTGRQKSLLEDYLQQELEQDQRVIFQNDSCVALVPFWAVWPFESMIVPKRKMAHISQMTSDESRDFGAAIGQLTQIYDRVFGVSFPYSAGIHQAPLDPQWQGGWHWHMLFYPPLLRSATIKKFMVGYEMFGMPQRDFTPEYAAGILKALV